MHEFITTDKPLITAGESAYPNSPKLRRKYQFTDRYGEQVELYREDGDLLWLPRSLCPVGADDQRTLGAEAHFPKEPVPREYQEPLFGELENMVAQNLSGVISAPTGWGKTVIGYKLMYMLKRKTLVVTTKSDIYDQWIKGAVDILGMSESKIGEIRQDKCEVKDTDLCVSLVQSLSKDGKYPDWIFNLFGMVIYDECHRFPADHFQSVIGKCSAMYRYGLSATTERKDGKSTLFFSHIGPIRAKAPDTLMVPTVMRFKSEWKCPRVATTDKKTGATKIVRISHQADKMAHIHKLLAVDGERNKLIATLVRLARSKGRTIVVFSTNHMHLDMIERELIAQKVSKKDIGLYASASTKKEKLAQQAAIVKPILLTTYQMMGEGTSIDWIDTALWATPRSDVIQPAGRIRREFEDKRFPLIFDILDNDSHVYRTFGVKRLDWYKSLNAEVKDQF